MEDQQTKITRLEAENQQLRLALDTARVMCGEAAEFLELAAKAPTTPTPLVTVPGQSP